MKEITSQLFCNFEINSLIEVFYLFLYTCIHIFVYQHTDCELPPIPANGTVILTDYNVTTYSSSATQSCNIGYDLNGAVNISCGSDGNWSHPPVSCTLTGINNNKK